MHKKKFNLDQVLSMPSMPVPDRFSPLTYTIPGDSTPPSGIIGHHCLAVNYLVHGIFYRDGDVLRFQRTSELGLVNIQHLVNLKSMALFIPEAGIYSAQIVAEMRRRGLDPDQPSTMKMVKEEEE